MTDNIIDALVIEAKFKLEMCDGKCGAQVLVYNDADLKYWQDEAERTGHKLVFSFHVPEYFYMGSGIAHDVYQILPKGLVER